MQYLIIFCEAFTLFFAIISFFQFRPKRKARWAILCERCGATNNIIGSYLGIKILISIDIKLCQCNGEYAKLTIIPAIPE